ncbi:oxygenase MpaB family protein [Baekduia sp. Peel2402]|uniref:oxygenase MpaB family protein n=1 Tax=Baekduia sp. Peel2402 TaxID=3458296 RepID=UPI00403EA63F
MTAEASAAGAVVPTALRGVDLAVERFGALGQRWLDAMWVGDPLADAVAQDGGGASARLVRRAIAEGVESLGGDAPAPLRALFAELDAPPSWMDLDRCDRAAGHLARQGREYGLVLGAASLLAGAQNTVAGKPLAFTGRYAKNAAVRSIEVGDWLTAVTTPGGMARDGAGFERTVRVRMIHAHVRGHLRSHAEWDTDAWGLPIPQPYMAFTLAEFCSVALRAMGQLGARYSDAETEDIVHLWRCVGWYVGVEEALLPKTIDDYAPIEQLYALTSPGADPDDRAFVDALTEFQAAELARLLPARLTPSIIRGLQRAFVGDAIANDLGIPDTRWKHLPRLVAPLTYTLNGAHDRLIPGGRDRRTARAFRTRASEMERLRKTYNVGHDLVDDAA